MAAYRKVVRTDTSVEREKVTYRWPGVPQQLMKHSVYIATKPLS